MTFTVHTWKLSECWMMLSIAAITAPLPGGGTLYKVRLLLAVRCSMTFTYLEIVRILDDVEYGGEYGPAAWWRHAVQGQVAAGGQVQRDLYIPESCLNVG